MNTCACGSEFDSGRLSEARMQHAAQFTRPMPSSKVFARTKNFCRDLLILSIRGLLSLTLRDANDNTTLDADCQKTGGAETYLFCLRRHTRYRVPATRPGRFAARKEAPG